MTHPDQYEDVLVRLRDLYRQAEDVFEQRKVHPHYVEMDQVMSALASARSSVERARDELNRVIQLDVQARRRE